ncbi:MAG: tetratricopeptide repeat protein [Victivallales bacterium]|jgi:tetratricopeptide (TPR) repeat protein|nr:tetratricopeptide repeat protein [Victivallales bacterium]
MKKTIFIAMTLGVWFTALLAPLCADEASERRLGEEALANGDYKNAAKFFDNARQVAARDAEKWGANTLAMADAKLRGNDIEVAKHLLAEYRSRFPARSAGMLPGRILMAERRYSEAEDFFASLVSGATDPDIACAAELGIGQSRLLRKDYRGALEKFTQLENENADLPQWVRRALEARIYTLIESGDIKSAETLLNTSKYRKDNPRYWRILDLFAALRGGDFDRFFGDWSELRKAGWKRSTPMLYELAIDGARLALHKQRRDAAEVLWSDAFDLAPSEIERQNALRELINLQAGHDPELAAESVRRYLKFFPDDPDRIGLLMRGARLLSNIGNVKQSVELYSRITGDNRIPAESRLAAAREAAIAASTAKLYDLAEPMFRYLIDQSETPAQKQEGELLLGEHFFRCGDFVQAAKLLKSVSDGNGIRAETARFWLLRSQIMLKSYADAVPLAEKLRDAKDPKLRVAAEYFRAYLLEKRDQLSSARSAYERFLILHPDSEYVPAAILSAAELALALRDYSVAAEGFFRYADLKPTPDDAARALYLAMQSGYFGKRQEDVNRALKLLDERFPGKAGSLEAHLQLADYLLAGRDLSGAEAQLSKLEQFQDAKAPEVVAELLFRRAQIAVAKSDLDQAKSLLKTLLKSEEKSVFAADAAMLLGNIESDSGRYSEALAHYQEAQKLRPDGRFGRIASGRIADSFYSIYAETLNLKDLAAATELYKKLSQDSADPRFQLQSLYKLGKCRELSDEPELALETYNRILYIALDQKRRGMIPDPVWVGKAGYAAALVYLKPGTPSGAREALRVIWILEELQLSTGEDFARIRQEIQKKYNLQRKP